MKKKIIIGALTIVCLAVFVVGLYFILKHFGITSVEGIRAIVEKCGVWGWLVFLLLQIAVTSLLCFIPATSMTFIVVSVILFGALKGFAISASGVILSSFSMFLIGRFGSEKIAKKIVGEQSLKKAQDLIDFKSKIFLPLMFIFPAFPDDALCMVAGMTKMRWWYFLIVVIICRTIGVATICFLGGGLIDWASLSLVDWFVLVNVVIVDIYAVFRVSNKIENKIKQKKSEEKEDE